MDERGAASAHRPLHRCCVGCHQTPAVGDGARKETGCAVLFQLAGDVVLETESAVALLAGYPPATLDAYDAGPSSGSDCVGAAEIGRLIVIEPLSRPIDGHDCLACPRRRRAVYPIITPRILPTTRPQCRRWDTPGC